MKLLMNFIANEKNHRKINLFIIYNHDIFLITISYEFL